MLFLKTSILHISKMFKDIVLQAKDVAKLSEYVLTMQKALVGCPGPIILSVLTHACNTYTPELETEG